jgi:hypothetical protein
VVLRCLCKYLRQTGIAYSQDYMEDIHDYQHSGFQFRHQDPGGYRPGRHHRSWGHPEPSARSCR